jgi:ribonuclease J
MTTGQDELVFVPLGGVGEIGMNAALYGFGPAKRRKWIMVDCGMGFAGEEGFPGIDLMFPDLSFIEERKDDLLAIFITHAHEDHIGAIGELWPKLKAPVYATRFAKNLLEARRLSEPGAPKVVLKEIQAGRRVQIGPFEIEYVPVSHSIPESNAVAIRTPHGLVLHTGDWKLDPTPILGDVTSESAFRALGDEGILAMISDSTNVVREGRSPSEAEVAATLRELIAEAPHRVAVTTFASNVARMRAVAEAAQACGARSSPSAVPWTGSSRSPANAASSTGCPSSARPTAMATCRATRSWRSSPAPRVRIGRRSPASRATTTRTSRSPPATA